MKILHIIASVNPAAGGPIEGIKRQDEVCRRQGLAVQRELVTLDTPDSPYLAEMMMPVHALGAPVRKGLIGRLQKRYAYSAQFTGWLRKHIHNYDVAIVHGLWNYAPFGASRVLPGGSTPYFVFTHGMMDPWFRKTYPLKHLAKTFFWIFGEGRLLNSAQSVFFTSEEERLLARNQFPFWRYAETVVDYGTSAPPATRDRDGRALRNRLPELGDRPYLLFLSRIHRKKGCDLLIEAFAEAFREDEETQLVIAGPDEAGLTETLRKRAEDLSIGKRVHWPGMLRGQDKWDAFSGAEAFVLPSHQENFGIVVAEALACGTPALVTDKVNIWREVIEAGAGLVGRDDLEGCTSLLSAWRKIPQTERLAMGSAARELFASKFDLEHSAPSLIGNIESMIRSSRNGERKSA